MLKRDIFVYFINRSAFDIQNNENKVAKWPKDHIGGVNYYSGHIGRHLEFLSSPSS